MTDNAWNYTHSVPWPASSAPPHRTRADQAPLPLAERQSERFNRTLQVEWAYRQPFMSNQDRTAALQPWLRNTIIDVATVLSGADPDQPTVTDLMAGYT